MKEEKCDEAQGEKDDDMNAEKAPPNAQPEQSADQDDQDMQEPESSDRPEELRNPKRTREEPMTPEPRSSMDEGMMYSPDSSAPIPPPKKLQNTEEMKAAGAGNNVDQSMPGEIGQLTRGVHRCCYCGSAHASRNKLFHHVRYSCSRKS